MEAFALNSVVTADVLAGVLDQVINVLPTIIPVSIGFIAIRKGISFVLGMLRAA